MNLVNKTSKVGLALIPVVVGALLAGGTLLGAPVLKWLPEIVHTIFGWVLIAVGAMGIYKAVK